MLIVYLTNKKSPNKSISCCLYVSKLEHDFFGKNQNLALPKAARKEKKELTHSSSDCKSNQDRLRLSFNIVDDDDTW